MSYLCTTMQDTYRQIFELATSEIPHRHFKWLNEEAVIYRGFRIAKKDNTYTWHDARYSNYMEPVDPKITEKILELGFCEAITQVMIHTDKDRVLELQRQMEKIDAEVTYWTGQASKSHNKAVSGQRRAEKDGDQAKLKSIKKKYDKDKARFAKKRGVLKSEREALQADIDFYKSRIKLYNPN